MWFWLVDVHSTSRIYFHRAYSLAGAYRKLIVLPGKLSWKLVRHASETDNLIRSDLEALNGEPEPQSVEDGPLRALLVEFQLPSSTYATMVLREILKADTSPAAQTKLSALMAEKDAALAAEKRKLEAEDGDENEDDDENDNDDDDGDDSDEADAPKAKKSKSDN